MSRYELLHLPSHRRGHIRRYRKPLIYLDISVRNLVEIYYRVHEFLAIRLENQSFDDKQDVKKVIL